MSIRYTADELAQQLGVDIVTEEQVIQLGSDGYERRLDPGTQVLTQGLDVWQKRAQSDGWELFGILTERTPDPPQVLPPTTDDIQIVSKRASNTTPPGALGGGPLAAFPVPTSGHRGNGGAPRVRRAAPRDLLRRRYWLLISE